ncbi:MAG: chemotaxis protein CheB [Alphaproteobacteria bacterium]
MAEGRPKKTTGARAGVKESGGGRRGNAGQADFPVVGVGASAGGLDAFKRLLAAIPDDTGTAFVFIQHLDPNHESLMADLLARHTRMKVIEARDNMALQPDHVFMIPPGKFIRIADNGLFLDEPVTERGLRLPIDYFFRSLAEARGDRAIGIVLSGTGSDGALGLKEIKGAGGMVMAQQPDTAEYDGMPKSAVATGIVDFTLPIEEIPKAISNYVRHPMIGGRRRPATLDQEAPDHFRSMLDVLRTRTRRDFRCYKKGTLSRRIQRRMGLRHVVDADAYLELLRSDPEEVHLLFKDLLIGVTRFFRDPEIWQDLERLVVEPLVGRKKTGEPIRVWVPGCATGEEAFSLAMLFCRQIDLQKRDLELQVFATDMDEDAIAVARAGLYPLSISADLPKHMRENFFSEEDGKLRIKKRLRECTVFAMQDVIGDPPFSNIDLISCRNLMIYLDSTIQNNLLDLLHFALSKGGFLFLGNSESIGNNSGLFEPVSKASRIYRRLERSTPRHLSLPIGQAGDGSKPTKQLGAKIDSGRFGLIDEAHRILLNRFTPAAVLINQHYEVLFLHGPLRQYFDVPSGEPTKILTSMVLEGLRGKLRVALHRAGHERQPATAVASNVRRNGHHVSVRITVEPAGSAIDHDMLLVTFTDEPAVTAEAATAQTAAGALVEDDAMKQLEYELQATREDLQSTIEELETANEELKASNEEAMSTNEELQSTNEELETSREELQSLNEELSTVNRQLEDKIMELEGANNDLGNLLTSSDIATLFLDTELRIRRLTPAGADLLSAIDSDIGRPLSDLALQVKDPTLIEDARRVLKWLTPISAEVRDGDDRWFLRHVRPYRTSDNRIDGVVITFAEVTGLKRTAEQLQQREQQQQAVAELGVQGLANTNLSVLFKQAVRTLRDTLAVDFTKILELLPDRSGCLLRAGLGWRRGLVGKARVGIGLDSQAGYTLQSSSPIVVEDVRKEKRFRGPALLSDHGVISGLSVIIGPVDDPWGVLGVHTRSQRTMTLDDVNFVQAVANILYTAIVRHRSDESLKDHQRQLALVLDTAEIGMWRWDIESDKLTWDDQQRAIMHWPKGKPPPNAQDFFAMIHPDDAARLTRAVDKIIKSRKSELHEEFRVVLPDGETVWLASRSRVARNRSGKALAFAGVNFDTTALKEANAKLASLNAERTTALLRLRAIRDNAVDGLITIDDSGKVEDYNPACERIFGYSADEVVGRNISLLMHPADAERHDTYLQRYMATGEAQIIGKGREVEGRRKDGSSVPLDLSVSEIRMGDRRLFSGILRDISERRQTEHRQHLLMAELDHRVKNVLANIGAMAHQTKASAASIDDYIDGLEGRIHALATAQTLLSRTRWRGARLCQLVDEVVQAFADAGSDRFQVSGDDVVLRPTAAQSLILALHELAINAVKYGALSTPGGKVALRWALAPANGARCLRLEWRESGGPVVTPPTRSGFGMTVIREFLTSDLKAKVSLTFPAKGVLCVIELPASQLAARAEDDGPPKEAAGDMANGAGGDDVMPVKPRILVVEDSSIVSKEIAAVLEERGYEMIGPASSVASAAALLDREAVDAAILDLNLDGESAEPIAEQLQSRAIPYLLATGYDPETVLPTHLKAARSLRKPFRQRELVGALRELFEGG